MKRFAVACVLIVALGGGLLIARAFLSAGDRRLPLPDAANAAGLERAKQAAVSVHSKAPFQSFGVSRCTTLPLRMTSTRSMSLSAAYAARMVTSPPAGAANCAAFISSGQGST